MVAAWTRQQLPRCGLASPHGGAAQQHQNHHIPPCCDLLMLLDRISAVQPPEQLWPQSPCAHHRWHVWLAVCLAVHALPAGAASHCCFFGHTALRPALFDSAAGACLSVLCRVCFIWAVAAGAWMVFVGAAAVQARGPVRCWGCCNLSRPGGCASAHVLQAVGDRYDATRSVPAPLGALAFATLPHAVTAASCRRRHRQHPAAAAALPRAPARVPCG